MIKGKLAEQVAQLVEEGRPFALATVVRSRRPSSVRPGYSAVVLADGTIEGFVGGVCAESSVRLYALRALETGEPLLLRLVPDDAEDDLEDGADAIEGAVVEHNPCLSGGSLEIFLEPHIPAARIVIVGSAPIADALARVAGAAGFDAVQAGGEDVHPAAGDAAVVVASHGADEERVLAEALTAGVPYVALVASATRGDAVRAELEVPDELRSQLHTPAGMDIGAGTPEEVAIAILAELIAERHAHPGAHPVEIVSAVDPVCGMEVAVTGATPYLDVGGERAHFCSSGCRDTYAEQHAGHGAAS
jgi:xanthine dehydrogenase accessory factor